jgi:hypothetical protein
MTDQTETAVDFDGCNRKCRQAGAHTLVWGECEHAPEPEPTVSLPRVYTDTDGFPSIGFDTYTVTQLAELIEPALHTIKIHLGPNALALLERGEEVRLSVGEYVSLALAAADAIVHRNAPSAPAVPAVPAVPAGQAPATYQTTPSRRAGLRAEIAAALEAADYRMDMRRGDLADAVLPVLYREWPWLRAEAEEAPTDRAVLREQIAEALMRWAEGNNAPQYASMRRPETVRANAYSRADAVLAILPAPVDRATVLRELADKAEEWDGHITVQELRRLAAEATPAVVAAVPGQADSEAHACSNCEGIDPGTCLMNPGRPPEQCPNSEFDGYGLQCQKPAGHNLCSFEEQPSVGAQQPKEARP